MFILYRTMSLLNVDRKVIAKVLSKRLEAVNPHMISTDLTFFLSGRNSCNNIQCFLNVV